MKAGKYFLGFCIFLLLTSLSFSSLAWQQDIRGNPATEPLVFQEKIAIGSADGNVYLLDTNGGRVVWKTAVNDTVQLIEYGGKLIVLGRDGKATALDKDGKKAWTYDFRQFNASIIYGGGKNSKGIFVTADNGVYKLVENSATKVYSLNSTCSRPAVDENSVIFGVSKNITKIDLNGNLQWTKELGEAVWKAYPVISGQAVYFGALDNKFYAFTSTGGYKRWEIVTGGWVLAPGLIEGGIVYFASNDGYVYAANTESGQVSWKTNVRFSVMSKPEAGTMGGEPVVFAGAADGNVYALKQDDGTIVWKGTAMDRAGKPLYYKKLLIFGSDDSSVYAYNTERACSIESPLDAEKVGRKEVGVSGKSVSEVGQQQVYININNGEWMETNVSEDGSWIYYLDPQEDLTEGLNTISCKVVDMGGEESGDSYTTVNFIMDSTIPLDSFVIVPAPSKPFEKETFTIFVNSMSDGAPVDRFALKIGEKEYEGDKNVTLRLDSAGVYAIEVTKIGYNKGTASVEVVSKEINPLYLIVGGVLLIIVLWQLYDKVISKRLPRK